MRYVSHTPVSMKANPETSEKWVQQIIVGDTRILGLGDLDVKEVERRQPHAGRLDLLLVDPDSSTRYEVELQLGSTDESHIIRTIEYWDTERKRYPQYEHVAVIVAEEITSRFFNVVSLFNGFIPIVAIQMQAIQVTDDELTLVFTKVLDQMSLGTEEADQGELTDRQYWEKKASKASLEIADRVFAIAKIADPAIEQTYRKFYVGMAKNGVSTLYLLMRPRKKHAILELRIPREDVIDELIDVAGIEMISYDARWGAYRLIVTNDGAEEHAELLAQLIRVARENYNS
jgi:hypothetical protein